MRGTSDSTHEEAFFFIEDPQAAPTTALDTAIESHETHLTAYPDCPVRGLHQCLMGNLLAERGARTGNREDTARAIDALRSATADPAVVEDPNLRGKSLYNLGKFLTKTEFAVSFESLQEGVDSYLQALPLLSGMERLACASSMLPEVLRVSDRANLPELRREARDIALEFLDEASADPLAESNIWSTLLDCLPKDPEAADILHSLIPKAEALTDRASPDGLRAERFDRLGRLLRATWRVTGESGLLTRSIAASRRAVSLRPTRGAMAANLALALGNAGTLHQDPHLLDESVYFWRKALERTPSDSDDHVSMRGDLGAVLFRLSEHRDQEENLREALGHTLAVVEHARREGNFGLLRTFLPNLAMARLQLASVTGDRDLMSDALEDHREALALPLASPVRARILNNYGATLSEIAERADRPATELHQACQAMAESLVLLPDDEPQLGEALTMYAGTVVKLLVHDDTNTMRNSAIEAWERVLARASSRSLREPAVLCRELLTAAYWRRYDDGADLGDLDRAIQHGEHVLRQPPRHSERRVRVAYFVAEAYRMRASVSLDPADFERAIDLVAEELDRPDLDDRTKRDYLTVQSANHHDRFHAFSSLPDLEVALAHAQQAVAVPVPSNPESAAVLQLAACLTQRHQQGGPPQDLDRAVEIYRTAWASIRGRLGNPPEADTGSASDAGGYRNVQISVVHNLASTLGQRYNRHKIPSDLDEALDAMVTVLRLTPDGHRRRSERLTAAANMFLSRWVLTGDPHDLATCLTHAEKAVSAATEGSFAHYYALASLVGIHGGVHEGQEDDVVAGSGENTGGGGGGESTTEGDDPLSRHGDSRDRAIELGLCAVESEQEVPLRSWTPVAHNTAAALLRRWLVAGDRRDLEMSIVLSRRAFDRAGLERSPVSALLLGQSLIRHARAYGFDAASDPPGTITEAAAVLRALATWAPAPASMRFAAARWWAAATGRPDEETLAACRQLMELMPLVAWVGAPRTVREAALADRAGLVSRAAQAALDAGRTTDAVEFLELGRGVLWSQSIDLRTDLAEIEEAEPELAARLAAVRHALDSSPSIGDVGGGPLPVADPPRLSLPQPVDPDWAAALVQARDLSISGDSDSLFDFLAPLTAADDPRVAASAEYGRALVLLDRGDRDGAREALVRAASHGPDIVPAAANALGDLLVADDDLEAARAAYEQAWDSADASEAEEAAAKLRQLDELEAATAHLDRPLARVLAHGDTHRLIATGLQLMTEGRLPQAQSFLDRALHHLPPEGKPLLAPLLAQLLQRTGDYAGARRTWELALKADDPEAVSASALAFGDFLACEYTLDEARAAYTLALDSPTAADEARARITAIARPAAATPVDLNFDYGRWLAHHEPREAALTPVTAAIEAGDLDPRTHYYLTEITDYAHDPDSQRARNHLHRVLALATDANTPLVLLCRARLRLIRGDRHGAQLLLHDAHQAAVTAGDAELAALAAVKEAELLRRGGDFDAAHAAYQRAVRTGHPSHSVAVAFDMAGMLEEAGREEEARSTYRFIMASGHPVQGGMSAVNLGVSLLRSGDTPGAVEAFEWAANGAWEDAAGRAREMLAKLASPP